MVTLWVWTNNILKFSGLHYLEEEKIFNNIELHVLDILYSVQYVYFELCAM